MTTQEDISREVYNLKKNKDKQMAQHRMEHKKLTPEELDENWELIKYNNWNVGFPTPYVRIKSHIAALEAEIARKDALINDILDSSRGTSGRIILELSFEAKIRAAMQAGEEK